MTGERFPVGETVYLGNWRFGTKRRSLRPMVVTKVARKYVTVVDPDRRYPVEHKFDKVTGHAPGESGDYIKTAADVAEDDACEDAQTRLKGLGFRSVHDFPRGLTSAALNEIADVVQRHLLDSGT